MILAPSKAVNESEQKNFPSVLVLSDVLPNANSNAGLSLQSFCSGMPREKLSFFEVYSRCSRYTGDELSKVVQKASAMKPEEKYPPNRRHSLDAVRRFLKENCSNRMAIRKIARQVAKYCEEVKAQKIWCQLQGQTLVRLSAEVSDLTGLPMLAQILEPPQYWSMENRLKGICSDIFIRDFEKVIQKAEHCATSSWAMTEWIKVTYGNDAITLITGLASDKCRPAKETLRKDGPLTILVAGQLYGTWELRCLLNTLHQVNWRVRGRKINVKVIGKSLYINNNWPLNLQFCGWQNQEQLMNSLAEADILFCPHFFEPSLVQTSRICFPSRLVPYLASGTPVIFHGPEYAAPVNFLRAYDAAAFAHSHELINIELYNAIDRLIFDEDFYRTRTANGRLAFLENLTRECMQSNFRQFLGLEK